jgi:hypothetical protein
MLLPGKVVLVDDSGKANVELRSETSVEARGDHTAQRAISSRSNVFKCHARCASSWQSQPAKCVICEVCFGFGWRVQRCCIERCCDKTCEWVDSDRPRESRGTTYTVSIRFIDLLEASWSCLMLKDVERIQNPERWFAGFRRMPWLACSWSIFCCRHCFPGCYAAYAM